MNSKYLIAPFLLLLITVSCKKQNEYLPPAFNYEIPEMAVTEDIRTGAYFSNYNTAAWNKGYADTPVLGNYNPLAADVMAKQVQWADKAKLDFFIFNWNGTSSNAIVDNFISQANGNVKLVVNFNMAHIGATNASPLTGTRLQNLKNEMVDLANRYFSKPQYYKIDGQPLIMITPLNLATNAASSIDFSKVVPAIRDTLKALNINPFILGEATTGWAPPQRFAASRNHVDAIVLSNWEVNNYDRSVFFHSFIDMNWKNWADTLSATGNTLFVPCVFPAYNDKKATPASKMYDFEREEKFYRTFANVAKRNMSVKKLVLLNSWNDFQKGTTLEPATNYGETYLNYTRQFFKKP